MFDSLRSLSDHQLLASTDDIAAQDRKLTLRLLQHLHEIERRRLYLMCGYGSMFDYCTRHLKYAEPSAIRRLRAARCLAAFPQLLPLLESGELSPTSVSMIAKHIKPDNAEAVIDGIKSRSTREVERFIAALQPLSVIPPDRVRSIVVPVASCAKSTFSADGKKASTAAETTSMGEPATLSVPAPVAALKLERRARIEFTAHEELMTKLDRIRALVSHRLAGNSTLEQLIDYMAEYVLRREDPLERLRRRLEREKQPAATQSVNPRQIPAHVRDQVFARDKGRCTFKSPAGRRCSSTHLVQLDQIVPVARGGPSTVENLRLLCAHHNRLEAERLMGPCGPPRGCAGTPGGAGRCGRPSACATPDNLVS